MDTYACLYLPSTPSARRGSTLEAAGSWGLLGQADSLTCNSQGPRAKSQTPFALAYAGSPGSARSLQLVPGYACVPGETAMNIRRFDRHVNIVRSQLQGHKVFGTANSLPIRITKAKTRVDDLGDHGVEAP